MSFQLIGCKQQNRHKKEKKIELTAMTEEWLDSSDMESVF
jgi:hypothetical protein